jgi:hypothetical protein
MTGKAIRPSVFMTYFLERARHYRFAAAMTKTPYEIERFCEIAGMFERMAHETTRSQLRSRFTTGGADCYIYSSNIEESSRLTIVIGARAAMR